MNGGEITISVKADYSEMERSLVEAEQKAATSAQGAADKYQSKFGAWLDRSRGGIQKKFEGFINPIQLLDRVADFAETAGEEGIGTAIENLVKSTPIIGAAYRLGTSIGTALVNAFGAETGEQMDARLQEEFEKTMEAADRRLKIIGQKEAEAREATATLQSAADLEFEIAVRRLEKEGDAKKAIFERGLREEQRLELEVANKIANVNSDAQKDALRREYDARIQLNADETRDKIAKQEEADAKIAADRAESDAKAIADAAEKERQAAEKVAAQRQKDAEAAARLAEKAASDKLAAQERAFAEATRIEEERISSQGAGVTSFNTALGAFKFDAYPDADKKRNDERMVRALENLVSTGGAGGFA
jgi:hypothetical protein